MSSDHLIQRDYFGTAKRERSTDSKDEGKSWKKIVEGLPQILCVKAYRPHGWAPTTKPNLKSKSRKGGKLHVRKESGAGNRLMQVFFTIPGPLS